MYLAHDIEVGQRTQDVQISQDISFDTMLLTPNTLKGLKSSGFSKPSPIQLHGIPMGKCGFDLFLEAKSGTGKTAVFSIIALEKLDVKKNLQTIILAPTREIATQICDVIKQIGSSHEGLKVEVVIGGLPVQEDILKFKKNVHIVVGCPGRLRHLIQEKYIDVSVVRLLVLDEADKLIEKSFQADVNFIFSVLPEQKQVIMSSATYSESSKLFIDQYVQNAQHICPDSNSILLGIEQKITIVKYNHNIVRQTQYRFEELLKILSKKRFKQCLIFCNYQTRVVDLHKMLIKQKWPSEQLYGQQEQSERLSAFKTLQEYKCRILVSTDLAARGIDASNVDLVINFEPPFEWQTYLHRIGRAGRFGSYGIAVTILSEGMEQKKFNNMLGSLKDCLNLNNLWTNGSDGCESNMNIPTTGDTSDNDDSENNSNVSSAFETSVSETNKSDCLSRKMMESECDIDNKHRMLWNLLTCDSNKKTEQIETFGQLSEMFEEFRNVNIESFSDLVRSFETHQEEPDICDENYTHNYWKKHVTSARECFVFVQDIFKDSSKVDIESNKKNYLNNDSHNRLPVCNGNTKNINSCGNTTGVAKIEQEKPIPSNTYYRSHNGLANCNNNQTLNEYEDLVMKEALRNAGLPTSFGNPKKNVKILKNSKKDLNRNSSSNQIENTVQSKQRNKSMCTKKHTIETLTNDISNEDVKHTNARNKSAKVDVNRNKNSQSQGNNSCGYNTLPYEYSQSQLTCHKTKTDQYTDGDYKSQSDDYKTKINMNRRSQNYFEWYNNLKYRMRQIEYAVYIDEITKF